MATSRRLVELDSRSFEKALEANPILIVPIGALEAHGPHLPLGSDQIQAESTATALVEKLDGLLAPTIPYGSCPGTREFPGTVSLSLTTVSSVVGGVLREFARMGVRRILVLSGHAERGHMAALREAGEETMRAAPSTRVVVLSDYDFVYELRGRWSPPDDGHGGLLETSRVMALAGTTVGTERPHVEHRGSPFLPGTPDRRDWPESVQGDTRKATPELGAAVQAHVLERMESTVRALLPR